MNYLQLKLDKTIYPYDIHIHIIATNTPRVFHVEKAVSTSFQRGIHMARV